MVQYLLNISDKFDIVDIEWILLQIIPFELQLWKRLANNSINAGSVLLGPATTAVVNLIESMHQSMFTFCLIQKSWLIVNRIYAVSIVIDDASSNEIVVSISFDAMKEIDYIREELLLIGEVYLILCV